MFRFFGGYPDVVCIRLIGVATARLPTPVLRYTNLSSLAPEWP